MEAANTWAHPTACPTHSDAGYVGLCFRNIPGNYPLKLRGDFYEYPRGSLPSQASRGPSHPAHAWRTAGIVFLAKNRHTKRHHSDHAATGTESQPLPSSTPIPLRTTRKRTRQQSADTKWATQTAFSGANSNAGSALLGPDHSGGRLATHRWNVVFCHLCFLLETIIIYHGETE